MTEPRQAKRWDAPQILMAVAAVSLMAAGVIRFVQGDPQTAFGAMMCAFVFGLCQRGYQRRRQPAAREGGG